MQTIFYILILIPKVFYLIFSEIIWSIIKKIKLYEIKKMQYALQKETLSENLHQFEKDLIIEQIKFYTNQIICLTQLFKQSDETFLKQRKLTLTKWKFL